MDADLKISTETQENSVFKNYWISGINILINAYSTSLQIIMYFVHDIWSGIEIKIWYASQPREMYFAKQPSWENN